MFTETKTDRISPQFPTCPNCGGSMMVISPDEFFETFAYCCEECGMCTKECNTTAEAYATLQYKHKETKK